jgi:hypothetical protein
MLVHGQRYTAGKHGGRMFWSVEVDSAYTMYYVLLCKPPNVIYDVNFSLCQYDKRLLDIRSMQEGLTLSPNQAHQQ